MPSLKQLLADPQTAWTTVEVSWYSQKRQTVEACSQTTLWCTQGHDSLPIRWLLVRDPQGEFKPTAFMSTDLSLTPERILRFFIGRWGLEVTFQEARAHLGLETQRQWSDLAIARTTPALLGLFSLVTLLAERLRQGHPLPVRHTAWYQKPEATFADALSLVRRHLWTHIKWVHSRPSTLTDTY